MIYAVHRAHPVLITPIELKHVSEWFNPFYVNFVEFGNKS